MMDGSIALTAGSLNDRIAEAATATMPAVEVPQQKANVWASSTGFLLDSRTPGFGIAAAAVLAIFCAILALCLPRHETWFDEAQAWLLARDVSLWDLFVHRLHYEGAPGLWHLLLWIEWRMHVDLAGMHVIAAALAAVGIFVWLRFNPLPRAFSLLVPLGFFLQFQYAVIARSYVLAAPLAFLLMALYASKKRHDMWFSVLAGLLANCSLHMAALSAGLVFLYVRDRVRTTDAKAQKLRVALPIAVLSVLFLGAVATAMPTADGSSTTANPIVTALRRSFAPAGTPPVPLVMPEVPVRQVADKPVVPPQGRLATYAWHVIQTAPDATNARKIEGACAKHLLVLLTAITVPVSTSNTLAGLFFVLLVFNLARVRLLAALVPYALLQVCNVLISGEAHHLGLLWIAVLCAMWALALRPIPDRPYSAPLRSALYGVATLVAALQIGWAYHAVRSDIQQPYASSKAAAEYLANLPPGTRVAAFDDDSVTVNAYLPARPYFNQQVDYWPFSKTLDADVYVARTMAQRPDVVMLKMAMPDSPVSDQWVKLMAAGTILTQPVLNFVQNAGYRETARFCGHRFFRNASESMDCRLVYQPIDRGRTSTAATSATR